MQKCRGEKVTSRLTDEIYAALPLGDARHHPRSAQSGAADVGKKPKLQWRAPAAATKAYLAAGGRR